MRINRLVMTGIGPFKDRQEIDFDQLASSGLFLIEGPTGSGKTTIIDAIVYALFGVVSSGAGDVTAMRIRSHYCGEADPSGVELHFTVDGRAHSVRRIPAGARDPDTPERRATASSTRQYLTEYFADGREPQTWTRAIEVAEHVTELLGMTAEQFRQLVVLPQGQFAELLRQTPADRLKSLAPLLEDPFIARVQDDLKAQGDLAQRSRTEAGQAVDRSAQQLAGRLKSHLEAQAEPPEVSFTDASASDEARRATVKAILDDLREQSRIAADEHAAQKAVADHLRDVAQQSSDILLVLRSARDAQASVDTARAELTADDIDVTAADVDARIGTLRNREGGLEVLAEWEADEPVRATQRASLVEKRDEANAAVELLRARRDALPGQRAALEAQRSLAQSRAGQLDAARIEEERLDELVRTAQQLEALKEQRASLARDVEAAHASDSLARQQEQEAFAHSEELAEQLQSATAADLAEGLVDGTACPVCGSCEHPAPAQASSDRTAITAKDVQTALGVATKARKAHEKAATALADAVGELALADARVAGLAGLLGGRPEAELAESLAAAATARSEAEAAVATLAALESQLAALADGERQLDAEIAEQSAEATRLTERIDGHDANEKQGAERIRAAIGAAASAADLLRDTRRRIASLESLAKAWQQHAVAVAAIPAEQRELTLEQAQEQSRVADEAHGDATRLLATLEQRATTTASLLADADPLARAFDKALTHLRTTEAQTAAAIGLAALVTANNIKRLQLRSYALQRRFESVLVAGSTHLERMSSGKFSFELNEDTAKAGQAGLGIWLYDSWTGRTQDPKSLSGGETFYASLALALGLADVIRGEAGGSALETLFVDEGFGSLDQDTLYQVLEQLDQLRAGNRAVGVVSHVTEMKESIPDRIEVRRQSDSTSTIAPASG